MRRCVVRGAWSVERSAVRGAKTERPRQVYLAGPLNALRIALYALRTALNALRDEAARLTIAGRGNGRVRGVDADTARRTGQLAMRHRRVPVPGTRHDRRYADARRVLIAVLRDEGRRTRVVGRIREERFLSSYEVAQVRLHRRDVRLRLRVGELRDRDRGQDADDDDHDQQLDERKALSIAEHVSLQEE